MILFIQKGAILLIVRVGVRKDFDADPNLYSSPKHGPRSKESLQMINKQCDCSEFLYQIYH